MQRHADADLRVLAMAPAQRVDQRQEAFAIVQEAALAMRGWRAAEAAVGIEDGQMRDADAGARGGRAVEGA